MQFAAGQAALEEELRNRIVIERPRLIQRLQDAIGDDSNLADNSDYQMVKTEQELNESRITELEDRIAHAEVIDISKLSGDIIKFGATVTAIDEDNKHKAVWQIVGQPEADAARGKISISSPIARALIGKSKGGVVEVITPSGVKTYKIIEVAWLNCDAKK